MKHENEIRTVNRKKESRFLKALFTVVALMGCVLPALAQKNAIWTAKLAPGEVRGGEGSQIIVTATVKAPWHVYSLTQPEGGPLKTTIEVVPGAVSAFGKPVQPKPKKGFDKGFNINIETFENKVSFGVPVKIKTGVSGKQTAKLKIRFMLCNDRACLPPSTEEVTVSFVVAKGAARGGKMKPITTVPKSASLTNPSQSEFLGMGAEENTLTLLTENRNEKMGGTFILAQSPVTSAPLPPTDSGGAGNAGGQVKEALGKGLIPFLSLSFGAGLIALLTPCVFPMIPITVSFFIKRKAGEPGGGLSGAFAYCAGIIGTFTILGVGVTVLFGAERLQQFAVNPIVNLAFGLLFVVLGLSLLGVYELALPASWTNSVQTNARSKSGYLQPFLMGLAFTMTSFTCTVPYVGTVLASATRGNIVTPMLGMFSFGLAFALPFFLLAIFPQALTKLPKSGQWLITVKAFMGLMEFAAALKFFSNTDLFYSSGILTREVFLASWAIIGIVAGLYLLGAIRFPKDPADEKIGVVRRTFGAATIGIALLCLLGVRGGSLGYAESFLPPSPYPFREGSPLAIKSVVPDKTSSSAGRPDSNAPIAWLKTYEEAVAKAKSLNKPILIDFTGLYCSNCRQMERNVFPKPEVESEFREYVTVQLYTDRGTPEDNKNQALLKQMANTIALPVYVAVTPDGKVVKKFEGLASSPADFVTFLQEGRGKGTTL